MGKVTRGPALHVHSTAGAGLLDSLVFSMQGSTARTVQPLLLNKMIRVQFRISSCSMRTVSASQSPNVLVASRLDPFQYRPDQSSTSTTIAQSSAVILNTTFNTSMQKPYTPPSLPPLLASLVEANLCLWWTRRISS